MPNESQHEHDAHVWATNDAGNAILAIGTPRTSAASTAAASTATAAAAAGRKIGQHFQGEEFAGTTAGVHVPHHPVERLRAAAKQSRGQLKEGHGCPPCSAVRQALGRLLRLLRPDRDPLEDGDAVPPAAELIQSLSSRSGDSHAHGDLYAGQRRPHFVSHLLEHGPRSHTVRQGYTRHSD